MMMGVMKTITKLNDVFPHWLAGAGIFGALQSLDVPWKNDNVALSLDVDYHGNHAGGRLISPLVESLSSGDELSADDKTMLATAVYSICGNKWAKEYATLSLTYDPINNYDMTEIMSDDTTVTEYGKTNTRTDNLSHTKTGTDTERPDLTETTTTDMEHSKSGTETDAPGTTETTTPNLTRQTETDVAGLNSSGFENANKTVETSTGTNTVSRSGSDTKTYDLTDTDGGTVTKETEGTNTTQYNTTDSDTGTQTYRDTGTDTNTRNYTLTRSGNIGVTTSQQMIQSERDLWLWDYFYNVVYPDIDRILTLPIY